MTDSLRADAEQLLHDLSRTLYGDQQQVEELALIEAFARRQRPEWQPIETCPGYGSDGPNRVVFRGVSRGRSFAHEAIVDGWLDHDRSPIHSYNYKLAITHWMPLPAPPVAHAEREGEARAASEGTDK